jgi:hypothetical protein
LRQMLKEDSRGQLLCLNALQFSYHRLQQLAPSLTDVEQDVKHWCVQSEQCSAAGCGRDGPCFIWKLLHSALNDCMWLGMNGLKCQLMSVPIMYNVCDASGLPTLLLLVVQ